jgi:hypothetical protein
LSEIITYLRFNMKKNKALTGLFILLSSSLLSIEACKSKDETKPAKTASPATVTTSDVTVFTQVKATCGGNITSDGGGSITTRGVCWSITPAPTIANSFKAATGTGTGAFSVEITGLNLGTKYYVRAYATNSAGTSYGLEKTFTTDATLALGLFYQGGLIYYIDGTNQHGLICAEADQGSMLRWGCSSKKITGATGTEVGKGPINTAAILADCSEPGTAADVCSKLTLNGYSDWFLPSTDELVLMHTNLKTKGLGDFGSKQYWTSTQSASDDKFAQVVRFDDGGTQFGGKDNMTNVRAARAF